MNPFDMRGPQFLAFYTVFAVVTIVVVAMLRRRRELADGGYRGTPLHDPYAIAYLRGGKNELLRVTVVSLVDRGLLSVLHDRVQTTTVGRETMARRRIERDVLVFCIGGCEPKELFASPTFDVATAELDFELSEMRLLPDDEIEAARRSLFFGATAVLLLVSIAKVVVALSRGRTNIGLLLLLTFFAVLGTRAVVFRRRTARGDAFLSELRNLFGSLKLRAPQIAPGGATSELTMLVAVWGVVALPGETFGWSSRLFPRAQHDGGSGSGSCGSSCGSGCGGCGG